MDRRAQHLHDAEHATFKAAHHRDLAAIHERLADCMGDDGEASDAHRDASECHKAAAAHYSKEAVYHSKLANEIGEGEYGQLSRGTRKAAGMAESFEGLQPDNVHAVIPDANIRAVYRHGQPPLGTDLIDPALKEFVRTDEVDSDKI